MGFKRVRIASFRGMDTHRGDWHDDLSTAADSLNFVCSNGTLRTADGTAEYAPLLPTEGARLFQGFFRDTDTKADRQVLMASGEGNLYAFIGGVWKCIGSGYHSDTWRAVNYRSADSERILLINGADNMISWDGVSEKAENIRVQQGNAELKFEHLTLLYERLWGAVDTSAPDRIYWSESFAPEDWEVDYDTPDAGGGFLDVATFDGSRIRAITAAFDDVLVFKDKSMHRISGTYPGEFSLTQVYGSEGTIAPSTVVHTADRLYFLGTDGLCVYNGMSVSTMAHGGDKKAEGIWQRMNPQAIDGACAAIYQDVLYLALPLDGAQQNSHVLEYRLQEGTYSLIALSGVRDFLVLREGQHEKLLCLIGRTVYEYGSGETLAGEQIQAYWLSPWLTLSTIAAKRTAGRVCMAVEAQGDSPRMLLTIIGRSRQRSKCVPLQKGVNLLRERIRLRDRQFRFRIENMGGCRLTLPDGIEIILEEDSDL